jgi:hypothetical protein
VWASPGRELAVPEVLGLALEAEQRVIRGAAPLDRVVADPGLLLMAVDHQDRGVDVEDQPRRGPGTSHHRLQQSIVERTELGQRCRGDAEQEASQGRRVGVTRQPREVLEHAVLPQELRRLDSFEPEDHRVEQRQEHLPHAVAVVALADVYLSGQASPQVQAAEEAMQQVYAAVVGQRA